MAAAAFEERGGLVDTSLPTPQFAEPRQSVGRHPGTADGQFVAGISKLTLGFVPRPARHADRRVLGSTDREQRLQPPLAAVLLNAIAPLDGASVIAGTIARGDQVAAGDANQHAIAQLAGKDRRA